MKLLNLFFKDMLMKIILGSQSPRRSEILSYFSIPFVQVPSSFDEDLVSFEGDPVKYAMTLSEKKAESLVGQFPQEIILTADTIVYFEDKIFNKPKSYEEAFQTVSMLSGKMHKVFTSATVRQGSVYHTEIEETRIFFNLLTSEQVHKYLSSTFHYDKAGSYAIQKTGSIIVQRIEGCYYNVMGLPINTVRRLLNKFGVDLWDYLKPC